MRISLTVIVITSLLIVPPNPFSPISINAEQHPHPFIRFNALMPPDGCSDFAPIAPPPNPIPLPHIASLTLKEWIEDERFIQDLIFTLIHPDANNATTWTKLTNFNPGQWQITNSQWHATCGQDDAQLTWATLAYLNQQDSNPWRIYTSPLPTWFTQRLANFQITPTQTQTLYLPLIALPIHPFTQTLPAPDIITATRTNQRCYTDTCTQLHITFAARQPNGEPHFILFQHPSENPIWATFDESRDLPPNEAHFATAVLSILNGDPTQLNLYDVPSWLLALL